ncbi:chaperone-usher fimbrial major subunit [Enterobacter bugandensis]|uniref:chaperone-usher fimbrial major subunit n=1 Tax=Enterobacter TaxID=547 RepID=UPI0012999A18|nr:MULTISPECIES: chaperone-usher fimbrial major subunit [Enterobacter]EMC1015532.1 fimbrial protein [Enterobacter bugandensis]MBE4812134.1 fimbrial protein [Enterobacter cloacae complex sp. P44RS]MBE4829381.1 fimbrial protein [Enterobacter cloacae complex sp. P42RS]MBE4838409.1 fimbrial protein [Enterobacter cloacae complex sp. P46RS]MBE4842623.1 fimbrial protein [Enterobacter cloacae complex sp. P42C]
MKRNIFTGILALSSLFLANQVIASDGIVHFRGEVVDTTCEVTSDTAGQTVNIGKVGKTAFTGIDSTASVKDFHIRLDKCPTTYTQAAVRFDGTEDKDTIGKGYLAIGTPVVGDTGTDGTFTGGDTAVAATGVAIKLYNLKDDTAVPLYGNSAYSPITAGKADLGFKAKYVQTLATVTPGTANADSQFTIEYLK